MSIVYQFYDKIVLVTGAGSGIGAYTALLFAKSGANVVLSGRNADNVALVAKQCRAVSLNESKTLEVVADLTKEDDCKRLIDSTIKEFGKLDILVNNAGIALLSDITDADYMKTYKEVMETNLQSLVFLTHISAEHLAKTKGNIINTSSLGSTKVIEGFSAYCMSKAGIDMFTKCAAVELADKHIRVNSVNAGLIKTNLYAGIGVPEAKYDQFCGDFGAKHPVHRYGVPEDVANAILYLASDNASFITGTNMIVDGGAAAANLQLHCLRQMKAMKNN